MAQSKHAQVLAYFAINIDAFGVNDFRSLLGDIERSPTISKTTGNKGLTTKFTRYGGLRGAEAA
jgi:hypothetical protein